MPLVGSGVIGPGGSEYFDVVLSGGHTYAVLVEPFEPTVDFDLYIYDAAGNLVSQDDSTAANAYCAIRPLWTGLFRLMVKAHRGLSGYRIQVQE
jgi:hypothetical protein